MYYDKRELILSEMKLSKSKIKIILIVHFLLSSSLSMCLNKDTNFVSITEPTHSLKIMPRNRSLQDSFSGVYTILHPCSSINTTSNGTLLFKYMFGAIFNLQFYCVKIETNINWSLRRQLKTMADCQIRRPIIICKVLSI